MVAVVVEACGLEAELFLRLLRGCRGYLFRRFSTRDQRPRAIKCATCSYASTYLPRLDSMSSQAVCRVRQCQHGIPSAASHFTRLALQALQAMRARRIIGDSWSIPAASITSFVVDIPRGLAGCIDLLGKELGRTWRVAEGNE